MRHAAAATILAITLVAACSSQYEDAPPLTQAPAAATESSNSASTPQTEASPTSPDAGAGHTQKPGSPSGGAPGLPQIPEEAKENTAAGAEAFALYYIAVLNFANRNPHAQIPNALTEKSCTSCKKHKESIAYSAKVGERLVHDMWQVKKIVHITTTETGETLVRADIKQPEQHFRTEAGADGRLLPLAEQSLYIELAHEESWKVVEATAGQA